MPEPNRQTVREDDLGTSASRPSQGAGPLATLKNDPFSFSAYNYPVDIETLSHAMLFNINVHADSADFQTKREEEADGTYVDFNGQERLSEASQGGGFVGRQRRLTQGKLGLVRRYKRVKRAISLYIPDTVVFENAQKYETPSLIEKLGVLGTAAATASNNGGALTQVLRGAAQSSSGRTGNAYLDLILQGFGNELGQALGNIGGGVGAAAAGFAAGPLGNKDRNYLVPFLRTFASVTGYALNPVIEVLYNQPNLRTFNFDFIFTPRSEREADIVWKIIYEFRRHSAPEFAQNFLGLGALGGLILIPPSEFDITFLRKTTAGFIENTNIPRMSTCVLSNVQVDYSPQGQFVTFEDGMPIQIAMRLSFIELNVITREAIDKGY